MSRLIACPNIISGVLKLPDGVKNIEYGVLLTCSQVTGIVLPKEFENFDKEAIKNFQVFNSVEVSADNEKYSSKDGVLYNKDKSKLLFCPKDLGGKCTIADETTKVELKAFENCTKITSVYIPEKLINFYLRFEGCDNLNDFYVSENNTEFTSEDGIIYNIQYVKADEAVNAPTYLDKEGYKFIKWDKNYDKIVSDLVVNAIYEKLSDESLDDLDDSKNTDKDDPKLPDKVVDNTDDKTSTKTPSAGTETVIPESDKQKDDNSHKTSDQSSIAVIFSMISGLIGAIKYKKK